MKQRLENTVDCLSTKILPAGKSEERLNLSKPDSTEVTFQGNLTGVCWDHGIFPTVKTSDGNRKMKNVMDGLRQFVWLGNREVKIAKTCGKFGRCLLNWPGIGRLSGIITTVLALLWAVGFNSEALAHVQEMVSDQYKAPLRSIELLSASVNAQAARVNELSAAINAQTSIIESLQTLMIAGFASGFVVAGVMFWMLCKKIDGFGNSMNASIDGVGNQFSTQFDNMKDDVNTKFDNLKEDVNTKFDNMRENVKPQFQSLKELISENRKKNQEDHHRMELILNEVLWYLKGVKSDLIPEIPGRAETKESEHV